MIERQTWNDSDDAAYWTEQERELSEPIDPEVALDAAIDKLSRYRNHAEPALAGMVPALEATIARLRPLVAARYADARAAEDAEWTRETTMARRETWNVAVRSGRYLTPSGMLLVANVIAAVGFHHDDLKHHIGRHGL